jgi:hypothetical protein
MVRQAHHEVQVVEITRPHPELVEGWSRKFGFFSGLLGREPKFKDAERKLAMGCTADANFAGSNARGSVSFFCLAQLQHGPF